MKTNWLIAGFCLLLGFSVIAQDKSAIHTELQKRLIEMGKEDQKHRTELMEMMDKVNGPDKEKFMPQYIKLVEAQSAIDTKLMQELETIIAQHGWPTISRVGPEASGNAFLILQHADLSYQKKYFPLLKEAVAKNDVRKSNVALLEDRILMREGKKQIYGSQLRSNPTTGKLELYPIEDEENVDQRRASMGLEPLKDYLKRFKLDYEPPKKQG